METYFIVWHVSASVHVGQHVKGNDCTCMHMCVCVCVFLKAQGSEKDQTEEADLYNCLICCIVLLVCGKLRM